MPSKNLFKISRRLLGCFLYFSVFGFVPIVSAQVNDAPVEVQIPHRPTAFLGTDGRLHLAYELHVSNFYESSGVLTIKRFSIFKDAVTESISTYIEGGLMNLLNAEEVPQKGTDLVIQPGKRVVLFVWLTLAPGATAPQRLHHAITFIDEKKQTHTLDGAATLVDQKDVLSLGAPLCAHNWLVDEGPGNARSHHWGSMLAENGIVTIPQRFAIDFFGLNDAGHAVETSPDKLNKTQNTQWVGFGTEVLAVHDAVVSDMCDSVADHLPLSPLPEPKEITARGVYGNFIVLEIAPGVFAHYAHLQHGSIKVHKGQHLKMGDIMARLGDSGNAGGPHLHFHVSDKPTFELSEGIPFVFSTMEVLGKTDDGVMLDATSKFKAQPSAQKNALPLFGDVVRF